MINPVPGLVSQLGRAGPTAECPDSVHAGEGANSPQAMSANARSSNSWLGVARKSYDCSSEGIRGVLNRDLVNAFKLPFVLARTPCSPTSQSEMKRDGVFP